MFVILILRFTFFCCPDPCPYMYFFGLFTVLTFFTFLCLLTLYSVYRVYYRSVLYPCSLTLLSLCPLFHLLYFAYFLFSLGFSTLCVAFFSDHTSPHFTQFRFFLYCPFFFPTTFLHFLLMLMTVHTFRNIPNLFYFTLLYVHDGPYSLRCPYLSLRFAQIPNLSFSIFYMPLPFHTLPYVRQHHVQLFAGGGVGACRQGHVALVITPILNKTTHCRNTGHGWRTGQRRCYMVPTGTGRCTWPAWTSRLPSTWSSWVLLQEYSWRRGAWMDFRDVAEGDERPKGCRGEGGSQLLSLARRNLHTVVPTTIDCTTPLYFCRTNYDILELIRGSRHTVVEKHLPWRMLFTFRLEGGWNHRLRLENSREDGMWHRFRQKQSVLMWT